MAAMKRRWKWLGFLAWAGLAIAGIWVTHAFLLPRRSSLRDMAALDRRLEEENRAILDRTRELQENQRRFMTDPAFVIRAAHEAKRMRTNETVFIFPLPGEEPALP